nr:MAG TPA: hypothetical protein [Caudoviricetes sp.]
MGICKKKNKKKGVLTYVSTNAIINVSTKRR